MLSPQFFFIAVGW